MGGSREKRGIIGEEIGRKIKNGKGKEERGDSSFSVISGVWSVM